MATTTTGALNGLRAEDASDRVVHRSVRALHGLVSGRLVASSTARLPSEEIRLWGEVVDVRQGDYYWFVDLMDAKVDGLIVSATLPLHVEPPPPGYTVGIDGHLRMRQTGAGLALELHGTRLSVKGVSSRARTREGATRRGSTKHAAAGQPQSLLGRVVVIVTASSSRALGDFRRNLGLDLGSAPVELEYVRLSDATDVARGITAAAGRRDAGLVVLIRGGGDPGELSTLSDPEVTRAVATAASRLPVLTGIGHADDWTLADEVASRSASTPSHSARIVGGMLRRETSGRAATVQRVRHRRSRRLLVVLVLAAVAAAAYFALRAGPRREGDSRPAVSGNPAPSSSGAPTRSKQGQRSR